MSFIKPAAHLFTFSFLFGGNIFYSYIASPIAFKHLDRENFSKLQNKVFPIFFQIQSLAPALLFLTLPSKSILYTKAPLISLAVCAASGLANLVWLLPWTRKVKEQRKHLAQKYSAEDQKHLLEIEDAPLRKEFGKSHGLSLLFNLTHCVSLTVYGAYLVKLLKFVPK